MSRLRSATAGIMLLALEAVFVPAATLTALTIICIPTLL